MMKKRLHPWTGFKQPDPRKRFWQRWCRYAYWAPPVSIHGRKSSQDDVEFTLTAKETALFISQGIVDDVAHQVGKQIDMIERARRLVALNTRRPQRPHFASSRRRGRMTRMRRGGAVLYV